MPAPIQKSRQENLSGYAELNALIVSRQDQEKRATDPNSPYRLYPTTVNYTDVHGYALIHYAAALGDLDKVAELVATGADVNLKTSVQIFSVINIALAYGHLHVAQFLVAKGADCKVITPALCKDELTRAWMKSILVAGRRPSDDKSQIAKQAAAIGDIEWMQTFAEHDPAAFKLLLNADNLYRKAAKNGELGMLQFLISTNMPTSLAKILISAIRYQQQTIVDYLLTLDIDVNQTDHAKNTALTYAIRTHNKTAMQQLLRLGARLTDVNCDGNTLLHQAIAHESSQLADLLLYPEIKNLLHQENIYGHSPLDFALWSNNPAITQLVVPLAEAQPTPKPKPIRIDQFITLSKMRYFLRSQYRDTTFLPNDGHCNGFAFLKLVYTARGMENYYFNTLALMANWDGKEQALTLPFRDIEPTVYGYKNLSELFEQWINDVVWFQHDLITTLGMSALRQRDHIDQYRLVAPALLNYNPKLIHNDFKFSYEGIKHKRTVEQLRENMLYFSRMPPATQLIFTGGEHATSAYMHAQQILLYYDPNFNFPPANQRDIAIITQQIIDHKYTLLCKPTDYIDIKTMIYFPEEKLDELHRAEIFFADEYPKSKADAIVFQSESPNRYSHLHIAVITHSLASFKKLISAGFCDLNAKSLDGDTALELAFANNFFEAIVWALQSTTVTKPTDITKLLDAACTATNHEIKTLILNRPELLGDLTHFFFRNEFHIKSAQMEEVIELFVTKYPDKIDATQLNQNLYGYFPLTKAIMCGNLKIIQYLRDNGVSWFIRDNGSTALREVLHQLGRQPEKVDQALEWLPAAQINQHDELGKTAIHYAVQFSRYDLFEKILHKGGDVQLRTTDGKSVWDIVSTPDSYYSFFGTQDKALIRAKLILTYKFNLADPSDVKHLHGLLITPLHTDELSTSFVPLLEQCTVYFLNQNVIQHHTPFLIYFFRNKQYNKIALLLEKRVDVNIQDENGDTLLMHLVTADAEAVPEKYDLIQLLLLYNPDLERVKLSPDAKILEPLFNLNGQQHPVAALSI